VFVEHGAVEIIKWRVPWFLAHNTILPARSGEVYSALCVGTRSAAARSPGTRSRRASQNADISPGPPSAAARTRRPCKGGSQSRATHRPDLSYRARRQRASHADRFAAPQELAAPAAADLEAWMRDRRFPVAPRRRWQGDGLCAQGLGRPRCPPRQPNLSHQQCRGASSQGTALGRKSWLFVGSGRGGERAAFMYTLIGSAKLNHGRLDRRA
jgi:hypothetical protein